MGDDYFCPDCGYSTANADEGMCPHCSKPLEFLKTSDEEGAAYPEGVVKNADEEEDLEGMTIKTDDDVKKEANEDL